MILHLIQNSIERILFANTVSPHELGQVRLQEVTIGASVLLIPPLC
jgi:hypothetical protein